MPIRKESIPLVDYNGDALQHTTQRMSKLIVPAMGGSGGSEGRPESVVDTGAVDLVNTGAVDHSDHPLRLLRDSLCGGDNHSDTSTLFYGLRPFVPATNTWSCHGRRCEAELLAEEQRNHAEDGTTIRQQQHQQGEHHRRHQLCACLHHRQGRKCRKSATSSVNAAESSIVVSTDVATASPMPLRARCY